jgi:hypothetical protein
MHNEVVRPFSVVGGTAIDWWEYQLVAEPKEALLEEIEKERSLFFNLDAETVQAQLVLAKFQAKEMMEETLIRWIQKICTLQGGFELNLNNYSGHPPHTVFIRVQDAEPVRQLVRQLKIVESLIQSEESSPAEWISAPCIPVASQLTEAGYHEALKVYAQREFHSRFEVSELLLYKRNFPGDAYQKLYRFVLPLKA